MSATNLRDDAKPDRRPRKIAVTPRYSVIGGGIVGVCTALALMEKGFSTRLFEARSPGAGASSGNAGIIAIASIAPTGVPGLARRVPRMLLDPLSPLAIDWRHFPQLAPWLISLLRNSSPERVAQITEARHALLSRSIAAYDDILNATGTSDLRRSQPKLTAFESDDGFRTFAAGQSGRLSRGIRVDLISGDEGREIEPALGANVKHVARFPDVHFFSDPAAVVRGLVDHFVRLGGVVVNDEILGFEGPQSKPTSLIGKQSNYLCDQVVIAAGPWSGALAKRLGVKLPIEAERGYHLMLGGAKGFKHAVNFHERYVGLTPMTNGLRITGMAEFAGLHAKPKMRRLDAVLKNIRQAVPGIGGSELLRWSGDRPSLPDSLPAIGRTVRAANVLFACGHDHLGMTMAPITGKLVAQLAAGERPDLNLTPYSPDRFK